MSWKFSTAVNSIGEKGCVFYAMPAGVKAKFADEDLLKAERRLKTPSTLERRLKVIDILASFDEGMGDVDDVIDKWEDAHGY